VPEDLEPFDAREYLNAGDWQTTLVDKGWHLAPGNIESVRKDYFSPLGWRIHVWVEREEKLKATPEDTFILAFGPNGNKLGGMWVTYDEALGAVDRLERLIQLDQPYDIVSANVAQFLGKIPRANESEDFDPREYFVGFEDVMSDLGYEHGGQRSYRKTIETPQVTFNVHITGAQPSLAVQGFIFVEGRPNDWMASGMWRGYFITVLARETQGDPPTDYLKQLDAKLTGYKGTFEQIEAELNQEASGLTANYNQALKAQNRVESLVNKLLDSEEVFDPREYITFDPSDVFKKELERAGWHLVRPDTNFGWQWGKDSGKDWPDDWHEVKGVRCNLRLYILPEFPHESHLQVSIKYLDSEGYEHWGLVDQDTIWWEMEQGESVKAYVARIEDDVDQYLVRALSREAEEHLE